MLATITFSSLTFQRVWLPDGWESGTLASPTDNSLFGAEVAARLTSLKAEMLEAGQKGPA
jgi:hypothetical protein